MGGIHNQSRRQQQADLMERSLKLSECTWADLVHAQQQLNKNPLLHLTAARQRVTRLARLLEMLEALFTETRPALRGRSTKCPS